MNRAAGRVHNDAAPIFLDAVKNMSVTDEWVCSKVVITPLPNFSKRKPMPSWCKSLHPKLISRLKMAVDYWNKLSSSYNKLPMVKKQNLKPTSYTTRKAVDGLYTYC